MVERIASITACPLLLTESIIQRNVETCGEVTAQMSKQMLFFCLLILGFGIDKKCQAPSRRLINEWHKSQFR